MIEWPEVPRAVFLDRDGTLVRDVPYNGDPRRVEPLPTVIEALALLRARAIPLAVVTNQSGVARGVLTTAQVEAVNRQVEQRVGPIDVWVVCPHGPAEGCSCRKPRPGMILEAAQRLGVDPGACALIGDIGADIQAGHAAGCRTVIVPTAVTLHEEIDAAPEIAGTLLEAVHLLLGAARRSVQ